MIPLGTPHTVTIKTRLGSGARGDQYAAPVKGQCWCEDAVTVIRNAAGFETVSTTRLFAEKSEAAKYTLDSLVTLPDGREARVIKASVNDSGALGLGVDHLQVELV